MSTCVCGHAKEQHIYHEGACRPGFVCPDGCKEFRPAHATGSRAAKEARSGVRAGAVGDREVAPDRAIFESEWHLDAPIKYPTLRQLWREWRCGRKHGHGPDGFYHPHAIHGTADFNVWLQECQACGRFTVWSERRNYG